MMKKFMLSVFSVMLMAAMVFSFAGCKSNNGDDSENVETGNFTYELVTNKDGLSCYDSDGKVIVDESGEPKKFDKYYKITGFTVSNEDLDKITGGDYSSVKDYRDIKIPETYKGLAGATEDYPVREIEQSAFAGNKVFTSVTVGKHIAEIGEGAFSGAINLKSLTLPYIGSSLDAKNEERLFAYVFGSVTYDAGVTETKVKTNVVYDDAGTDVSGNTELTYYIPTSLNEVTITGGDITVCAFLNASTLKKVNLHDGIKEIPSSAFSGCTSLLEVKLPKSVEKIADHAFNGAKNLCKFDFNGAEVKEIGNSAFANCSKLGEYGFILPTTLETVGEACFSGCVSLAEIDFSKTKVKTIAKSTFKGCSKLKKVVIESGFEVKIAAFKDCSSLTKEGIVDKNGNKIDSTSLTLEEAAFDEAFFD